MAVATLQSTARGRGFTLVELMVTIAVAAILLTIAVPSLTDTTLSGKLRASANDLVTSAALARSEAIKRNAVTSLCPSSDGASCGSGGWEQGWIVITGSTVIQTEKAAPQGFKVTSTVSRIDFQPSGVGSTQATLTVCRASPYAGNQERVVTVSATGRSYVTKTATGSCS
ncbi:GspH/FimT family pseudopilin [Pseudomonas panipatensis]|uniref:Type II secretion system protein H n=1 Tax=Pseudomonas panipatensis TaxID=428992 RepID=A0A1G8BYC4_9PSED|nr:GspH/FimT family pseudopilin [Pseudomonas panipatensis]SDH38069.1 type IV fimbrial biogenesis protein FimT [Pseudomonas panipatensis]SMP66796.1 type IV fimbrial biogenesis protein FimT [Pseudomonas panipatensis]